MPYPLTGKGYFLRFSVIGLGEPMPRLFVCSNFLTEFEWDVKEVEERTTKKGPRKEIFQLLMLFWDVDWF